MSKKKKAKKKKARKKKLLALLRLPNRNIEIKLVQVDQQGRAVYTFLPRKG